MLHDPSLAPLLRLIRAGLELHAAPFPPPPYGIEAQGSYRALTTGYSTSKGRGERRTTFVPNLLTGWGGHLLQVPSHDVYCSLMSLPSASMSLKDSCTVSHTCAGGYHGC